MSRTAFDVFVAFSSVDRKWVRRLARNLHQLGLKVFFDEWRIGPGDVIAHRLDEGLRTTRNGVLVVSEAAMQSGWVAEEYAAMIVRAVTGDLRLIPVLYGDAEMPPMLASRMWVDFRGADGPEYKRRVHELAAALRGEWGGPPLRGGGLRPAPGSGMRAEGPVRRTLRIGPDEVALLGDKERLSNRPRGVNHADEQRLWELERLRRHWPGDQLTRSPEPGTTTVDRLQRALLDAGVALGRSVLVGPVGDALRQVVGSVESRNVPFELALEIDDDRIADLPWETLRVPATDGDFGPPLALHSRVCLYRSVADTQPVTAIQIGGPLRVLVAIGSPESDNQRGELLDYEAELSAILDVVKAARSAGGAYVRILERGTVAAIHDALLQQRYHVLHISCHAAPGRLILEDQGGRADLVNAGQLASEVLPGGRGVPLVVLAGCYTAFSVRDREDRAEVLPGLARALLAHGVPSVLAMNASVGDVYATRLMGRVYSALAMTERPDPLVALSDIRRQIEIERAKSDGQARASRPEWATPVLFRRGPSLPLYDVRDAVETIKAAPEPVLAPGMTVRRVGEFVGRRREQRLLLRALRGERSGAVIHGLGGVGKSTLAAQLQFDLGEETGGETALVISVSGESGADQLLDVAGRRLVAYCIEHRLEAAHPYRELARVVRDPQLEWSDRLDYLSQLLLSREQVLLLLDNFEDNLVAGPEGGWAVEDGELGGLLASWVRSPGKSRLLVTSRYPFELPGGADRLLEKYHLGPLSWAETRKLIWRLPGLDVLSVEEQRRAYADVGGHPRTLEYLDALLRGGKAKFPEVAQRMESALAKLGIARPGRWMEGDLDRALAEVVTLGVDDVVLGELVGRLDRVELGRELLLGASVYREGVDEVGLAWQVSNVVDVEPDPAVEERRARLNRSVDEAAAAGRSTKLEELALEPGLVEQILEDMRRAMEPPLRVPEAMGAALEVLDELGLVAPVEGGEGEESGHLVHRWTARALAGMWQEEVRAAHARAAAYWLWRVKVWPQSRVADVNQLIEARHHLHAAGEVGQAVAVTGEVVEQLHTWGAYGWEVRLCEEVLRWVAAGSMEAAAYQHRLGNVSYQRGDYEGAQEWYRRSLAIKEELGNRAGMAISYHQLGMLAQTPGDYERAQDWHRRSLAIKEELGDRAGMANSYHQLGIVAHDRGDYVGAQEFYHRSLSINTELGNLAGMAPSYHQLGMLAQQREDYEGAQEWYRRSLAIKEELGDRSGMGITYHQLGIVAQQQRDYVAAQEWYRLSLVICEELGDRSGMASSYHQLGRVAQERGDYDVAHEWYRRSCAIFEELSNRVGVASSYHQMGVVLYLQGDYDAAQEWYHRSLAISEDLDNRAGIAVTLSQMGILLTDTHRLEEAVTLSLSALSLLLGMGLSQIDTEVHSLRRQRAALGEDRFRDLVRAHPSEMNLVNVLQLLDQTAGQ